MKSIVAFLAVSMCWVFMSSAAAQDKVVVIPLNSVKKLDNVVTVSAKGGDFTDPVAAVNSISDATVDNPYLVVIGPGIYTLTQTLTMSPFVSISGAGQKATILTGAVSTDSVGPTSAVISAADNTILSDLTVENTGGGDNAWALYIEDSSPTIQNVTTLSSNATFTAGVTAISSSSKLFNVTAKAFNGGNNSGVLSICSSLTMSNVTADVSGGTTNTGVHNYCYTNNKSASPILINVQAKASGGGFCVGIMNEGFSPNTPIMQNSHFEGSTNGLEAWNSTTQVRVMNSSITGGVRVESASLTCINSNNGIDKELDTDCREITHP